MRACSTTRVPLHRLPLSCLVAARKLAQACHRCRVDSAGMAKCIAQHKLFLVSNIQCTRLPLMIAHAGWCRKA